MGEKVLGILAAVLIGGLFGGGLIFVLSRDAAPVAYVWKNPVQVLMPVGDYAAQPVSTLQTCGFAD